MLSSDAQAPPREEGRAPAAGETVLECQGIRKEFEGVRALADVTLSIRAGELIGLVGPNGSGKSTLINVLNGVFPPTAGRVFFKGTDITGKPPHLISKAGIGRTYQIPRPFGSMTVAENVAFACMFREGGVTLHEAEEAAQRYLAFTGLQEQADALPDQVNLHQRKFLELARALATEPEVLMLDEVLSGLNPAEIDESVEMIRKIHDSGVTLIIVEHLMRVVTQLAQRIVVLNEGMILAEGQPEEVMNDPQVMTAYLGKRRA
jgi:branched-chain amino acid transport system permease protein